MPLVLLDAVSEPVLGSAAESEPALALYKDASAEFLKCGAKSVSTLPSLSSKGHRSSLRMSKRRVRDSGWSTLVASISTTGTLSCLLFDGALHGVIVDSLTCAPGAVFAVVVGVAGLGCRGVWDTGILIVAGAVPSALLEVALGASGSARASDVLG